ncbi:MAG: tyrosine-type recombinase/integrase [Aggregatilineales bacterium]
MNTTPESSIVVIDPPVNISTQPAHLTGDVSWMDYFDVSQAIRDWYAHLEALPTHKNERLTLKNYAPALIQFFAWSNAQLMGIPYERQSYKYQDILTFLDGVKAGHDAKIIHPLPTPQLLTAFFVWIRDTGRGISEVSFNRKYIAPLRIYFNALLNQDSNLSLDAYMRFTELKHSITRAKDFKLKNPPRTVDSPLTENGTRLSIIQVVQVLQSINTTTLQGLQDRALWLVSIHSAFRNAELSRITLDNIKRDGDITTITVRGKGDKTIPVPIGEEAYTALMDWVDAYNATDTPTPILPDQPIWRGFNKSGTIPRNPKSTNYGALGGRSIARHIKRMVKDALNIDFANHDTRRTAAWIAYESNMKLGNIQKFLRHANLAVTSAYIGTPRDFKGSTLSNFVQFT